MIIRAEQFEPLREGVVRNLENRLLDHVEEHFPRHIQVCGKEDLRPLVRRAIDKSREHHMVAEESVTLCLDLMLLLGVEFDTDPQPGLEEVLAENYPGERERARALDTAAREYYLRVAGPDGQLWLTAIRRFARFPEETALTPSSTAFGEDFVAVLGKFYPAKMAALSGERRSRLFDAARQAAANSGMESQQAAELFAVFMLLLGTGCFTDIRFAWLAAIAGKTSAAELDRLRILHRKGQQEFARWLR